MTSDRWQETTLGDIVTLQRGHDLPEPQRRPGMVPILGSFGVTGWHDEAKVLGPGVTVGRSGASIGVVNYTEQDYWPLNTALYARDFHGNNERFVYYLLLALDLRRYNSGSAQPSLNRNFVHPLPVRAPPLDEQHAIADILGSLDDKIELNRRMNGTLEAMARAIFKAWFIDFEPVKAKAAGATSFSGMSQDVFDQLPNQLTNSELGPIPEGWMVGSFGSVLRESTRRNNDESIDLVLSAVSSGELVSSDDHFTKRVYSKSTKNYKVVPPGGIAFNPSRINIGSVGVNHRRCDGVVSPVYVVCEMPSEFEWFFEFRLRLPQCRKHFDTLATGSVRQSLRAVDFLSIELVLPPHELIIAFDHEFLKLKALVDALNTESYTLAAIRDALLPKLISGKLRVCP